MLKKTCIRLSLSLYASPSYFEQMDLYELGETVEEVKAVNNKK